MRIVSLGLAVAASLAFATAIGFAQDREAVVLTIDGNIKNATARDFSIAQLEALGREKIETSTPWHDGKVTFEGVSLARLMEHVGASGGTAAVLALNNYRTEIPLSDFATYGVILATKKDGRYMSVSDKGPLFVIYPFDAFSELNSELYYSRSAWQVCSISIE